MTEREPLAGVARTAVGIAVVRARESERPDRLFDDPYARAFVDAAPPWFPTSRRDAERAGLDVAGVGAALAWHVSVRTRFYDDYLTAACRDGCRQVALLAAGLDARAFRLDWPARTSVFEVDLPEVLDFKQRVLAGVAAGARCRRVVVPADLREAWPDRLTGAGFTPGAATAWLVEGLLAYLSGEEAARLLTDVTRLSGPGSRIAFEHGGIAADPAFRDAGDARVTREYMALWKGGLGAEPAAWLGERGWRATVHGAAGVAGSYGRPAPAGARSGFVTGTLVATGDYPAR